jgi:uncharacterized protein (TIGR02246 family)
MRHSLIDVPHPLPCALAVCVLLAMAVPAWSADKDDVMTATTKWAEAFSDANPDRIVALYENDAVLWGTLSPKRRDDIEGIRDYMVAAFAALPDRKVVFGDQLIRIYGDIAINTGYYTFSFSRDGQPKSLPARYSIVYQKRPGGWMIVDHHSSAMPAQ